MVVEMVSNSFLGTRRPCRSQGYGEREKVELGGPWCAEGTEGEGGMAQVARGGEQRSGR